MRRYGMVCHICDDPILSWGDYQVDHVIPLSRHGTHTYDNVRPSHALCNHRKRAKLMSELFADGREVKRANDGGDNDIRISGGRPHADALADDQPFLAAART